MILCSCNKISDRDVAEAYNAGARTAKEVYRHLGTKLKCGSCIQSLREELQVQLTDRHNTLARLA